MTNQVTFQDPERGFEMRCGSALPLALLISILFAVYSSISAYFCGCGLLEILWAYSRNGFAACLSVATLFLVVRR